MEKNNDFAPFHLAFPVKDLTETHQFYTQILIEKNKPEIFIKSVMNDIEGISKISTCKKIEKFKNES